MLERFRRPSHARLLLAVVALVALVMAQGLRLCLHADDVFVHQSIGYSATGLHLEGDLMASDAGADEPGERHFDLGFGLLKHLSDAGAAILIAVFLVLFSPLRARQYFEPAESRLPYSSDPRRRPQPRAPPL